MTGSWLIRMVFVMARIEPVLSRLNPGRSMQVLPKAQLFLLAFCLFVVGKAAAQPLDINGEVVSETVSENPAAAGEAREEVVEEQLDPEEQLGLDLRNVITSWASAWQSQMDDIYLLHYDPDFVPEGFSTLADWEAARRTRISGPDTISISLREFELLTARENMAVVRLMLLYSRPGYADQTRKELVLRLRGHIWQITQERNLDVQILPSH